MGTLVMIGAAIGAGGRIIESAWPGVTTNIATKLWNGNISNGAIGGSGYTQATFCVTMDLEAQCDQVRFIFANTGSVASNVVDAKCYFGAAAVASGVSPLENSHFRTDQDNDATTITFTDAGTTVLPAYTETVGSTRKPKYLVSDWISLSSKDRTDSPGHNRPLLYIRYCLDVTPTQNIGLTPFGSSTYDHYSNGVLNTRGVPDVNGRWLVANAAANNVVSANTTAVLLPYGAAGTGPLCGVQYRTKDASNILTVASIGDSITEGATTPGVDTTHGGRHWAQRLCFALNAAGFPAEYVRFGFGGQPSATYRAMWENFITATGIKPPLALYSAYSPNNSPQYPTGANVDDLTAFVAHAATNDIVSAVWTGLPSSKWTPSYVETESVWSAAADAQRVAFNAAIMAGTFNADVVIDQATQFQINGTGTGGVGFAYGMVSSLTNGGGANPAGWHPDYAGYTSMINTFSAALTTELLPAYYG